MYRVLCSLVWVFLASIAKFVSFTLFYFAPIPVLFFKMHLNGLKLQMLAVLDTLWQTICSCCL